jgi:hypothetical protein
VKIAFALSLVLSILAFPCYADMVSRSPSTHDNSAFQKPPGGLFSSIVTAHGQEMVMSSFRSFDIVPVKPSSTFTDDVPEIFVVFHLHQHDSEFRVSGRWLVEQGEGVPANFVLGTDSMILMTEDESGYVSIRRPASGWPIGQYKVEIFTGTGDYDMDPIGILRFSVTQAKAAS